MRRGAWVRLATAAALLAGCHRPYFMTEADYAYYNRISGDYSTRERYDDVEKVAGLTPSTIVEFGQLQEWPLTLQEVKQLALAGSKRIAVLAYQPGEAGTRIDNALSAFDAQVGFGGQWARNESQVSSLVQNFGTSRDAFIQNAFGNPAGGYGNNLTGGGAVDGGPNASVLDMFGVAKRNATGGISSFGYSLDYQRSDPAGFSAVNPSWTGTARLGIQQPLLQGAGVEFNRAPTLIARAGFDISIADFDVQVRTLLRDVENAYWQLYFSYQDVYSREVGVELGLVVWQTAVEKFHVGRGNKADVAQARSEYERFRGFLVDAQNTLLTSERRLRELMGMTHTDGRRIIPKDKPTEAQFEPNWRIAFGEAMQLRPELTSQRFAVRRQEIELGRQKNGLLADLSFNAGYSISGLDNQLDQSFNRLLSNKYGSWQVGVRWTRPLGERAAHAAVNNAQLALSREQARLTELEHTVNHELNEAFRELSRSFAKIEIQRQTRLAAAEQLKARKEKYDQGSDTLDILVRAQSVFADALRDESQAVVQYNQALVVWEFAKGTILQNDNVQLAEEICCQVPDSVRQRVQLEMSRARPLAIHPGTEVHTDHVACPNSSLPLYREFDAQIAMPNGEPGGSVEPLAPPPTVTPKAKPAVEPVVPPKNSSAKAGDRPHVREERDSARLVRKLLSSDLYPSEPKPVAKTDASPEKEKAVEAELLPPIPAIGEGRADVEVKRAGSTRRDRTTAEDDWLPAPKNSTGASNEERDSWKPIVERTRRKPAE